MNIHKHKGVLYILIVIIPTLFVAVLFYSHNRQYLHMEKEKEAQKNAFSYKQNLDKFMSNTITSLETLSLMASAIKNENVKNDSEDAKIEYLLGELSNSPTDFSYYYYASPEGQLYLGSHPIDAPVDITDRDYFEEVSTKRVTVFSHFVTDRVLNQESIIAATPVENDEKELVGILIAILHLQNMENTIKSVVSYPYYTVQDEKGQQIIGQAPTDGKKYYPHTEQLAEDRVPWSVTVYANSVTADEIIQRCIPAVLFALVVTHILYLLILYYMLKKETAFEKRQNEIQKIELIGSLAASTAHEIRNPLTGIKGFVTLLSQKYDNPEDNLYFSIIQDEITRINEIISDFLVLGKPVEFAKEQHDLTAIIHEVFPMIQLEAKMNGVRVRHQFTTKPTPIYCSKNHIKQILLNLSKNALEAMKEDDTLTIKVRIKEDYVQLIVKDTGEGIPEDRLENIFQPFYTSKDTGTGLGLVICERIVDTYNGKIIINSIEGKGTTVQVFFPLCTE